MATSVQGGEDLESCRAAYLAAHGHPSLTKGDVCELLTRCGVAFERLDHPAVRTVEQGGLLGIPFERDMAKALFVREAGGAHYLVAVPGHAPVDLRGLRSRLGCRRLSLAPVAELAEGLGVCPGAVTPLAVLNEEPPHTIVVLDESFLREGRIGCHPCDNTASLLMATNDLVRLIRGHGNQVVLLDI